MTIGQLNTKHRIGQSLDHGALQLECAFFLRHKLSNLVARTPDYSAKDGQPMSLRQDPALPKFLGELEAALQALPIQIDAFLEGLENVGRKLHALFMSPKQPVLDASDLTRIALKIIIEA